MKLLSESEWIQFHKDIVTPKYKNQRIGQRYFNLLFDINYEVANEIRGTNFDPFYDDKKIGLFLSRIYPCCG